MKCHQTVLSEVGAQTQENFLAYLLIIFLFGYLKLFSFRRGSNAFLNGHPVMKVIWEAHTNFRAKAGLQPISYDNGLGE